MAGKSAALSVNIVADASKAAAAFSEVGNAGERMAQKLRASADKVEAKLAATDAIAERLAKTLGPEMSRTLGTAAIEKYAARFQRAGLTLDDVDQNAEELTRQMARLEAATEKAADATARVGTEADRSRSVMANFTGNALQEVPGLTNAFGPLNMAVGQFAEYAAEGGISMKGLATNVGVMAGVGVGIAVVSEVIDRLGEAQRQVSAQTDRTSQAMAAQIDMLYDWNSIGDQLGTNITMMADAQTIMNQKLIETVRAGGAMLGWMAQMGLGAEDVYTTLSDLDKDPVAALTKMGQAFGLPTKVAAELARNINDVEDAGEAAYRTHETGYPTLARAAEAMEFMQDRAEDVDLSKIAKETLDAAAAGNAAAAALILQAEGFTKLARDEAPEQVLEMFITLARNASTANSVLNESGTVLRDTRDAMWSLWGAQKALIDLQSGQRSQQARWQEALANATKTVDDSSTPWNEQAAAIDEAMAAADAIAGTYMDQQKGLADLAGTSFTATDGIWAQIEAYARLAAEVGPDGPVQAAIQSYIQLLWRQIELQAVIANQQNAGTRSVTLSGDRAQEYRAIKTAAAYNVPVMSIPGAGLIPGLQDNAGMTPVGSNVSVIVNMPAGANGDDVVRALQDWNNANGAIPISTTDTVRP